MYGPQRGEGRRQPSRVTASTASVRLSTPSVRRMGRDVVLHRRLGQAQRATDQLVVLALHQKRQHVDLALGQAQ